MNSKIGRNDPCPCGSGKKYKQCCLNSAHESHSTRKAHEGAIERAIEWLMSRHRPAVSEAIADIIFDDLSEEEVEALTSLDAEIFQSLQLNAMETLIAEEEILVHDEFVRVTDVLLGLGGPLFTVDQRAWIEQMSQRPLRLYDITDVVPGQQMTLCDALDKEAAPIVVLEKSGSNPDLLGTQIGVRLMRVDDHYELSGAAYPFSRLSSAGIMKELKDAQNDLADEPKELVDFTAYIIRLKWKEQYIYPAQLPTMVDTYTGEPILLVTDHYRVRNWDYLSQVLAGKRDVDGNRDSGWTRIKVCSDGVTRPLTSINPGKGHDRIEVFHNTQKKADKGRKWFEKLAGDTVTFSGRSVSDPIGMMNNLPNKPSSKSSAGQPDIPPEVLADMVEETIHRMYANWADEPLPALDDQSPRQALLTPAGRERVKGLLRSYEASEQKQAKDQRRRVISYAFLWEAVGLIPNQE